MIQEKKEELDRLVEIEPGFQEYITDARLDAAAAGCLSLSSSINPSFPSSILSCCVSNCSDAGDGGRRATKTSGRCPHSDQLTPKNARNWRARARVHSANRTRQSFDRKNDLVVYPTREKTHTHTTYKCSNTSVVFLLKIRTRCFMSRN